VHELIVGEEALRLAGELGEHKWLASDWFGAIDQRTPRKREHEQVGISRGHPCGLRERPPELGRRSREVPDAMSDDEIE
jgi:hypothetical protein